jgi:hypothetical protein
MSNQPVQNKLRGCRNMVVFALYMTTFFESSGIIRGLGCQAGSTGHSRLSCRDFLRCS